MKERLLSIRGIGEARAEQILRDYPTEEALVYALGKGEIEGKYPASIVDGLLLEFAAIEEEMEAATPPTPDPLVGDSFAAPPSPVVRLRSHQHYFRIPYDAADGERRTVDLTPGRWVDAPRVAVDTPYCQDLLRQGYLIKEE